MELKELPRLTEQQILRQTKLLGTPGVVTKRTLIESAQRGLIATPIGRGGGRGKKKTFGPETAAELHANARLFELALANTLAEIRITGELGRSIETAPNLTVENYAEETRRLSAAFAGKQEFNSAVVFWLREKWAALLRLYKHQLTITPRIESFASDTLQAWVYGLCTGFYLHHRLTAEGKLEPIDDTAKMLEPREAISVFTEQPPAMSAKPRE
jgi:hypothetical protein